jgi:homoserine O-acetyltransferase/O-succinyltransferase
MKKFWYNHQFDFEQGGALPGIEIAYHTYGNLNPSRDNVIWVCHALTANSEVLEWWPCLFGKNKTFDPAHYFIICANVVGGCYGTTGPLSASKYSNEAIGHEFPELTIRDMVRAHELLLAELRISGIAVGIGGSMGGMQILEWACNRPKLFKRLVLIATSARTSPWVMAWNESQRMAIEADPTWRSKGENSGMLGLRAARSIALLSYRSSEVYNESQYDEQNELKPLYRAHSYQRHQGDKLVRRFNAISYHRLTRAMDHHNVGRNRGGIDHALGLITAKTLVIGIDSDLLFPPVEQRRIKQSIHGADFVLIQSQFGHDGFLIDADKIGGIIGVFMRDSSKEVLERDVLSNEQKTNKWQ